MTKSKTCHLEKIYTWTRLIAEVLNFDDSMPKDTWFPLNFNFLKVEVGYFS